MYDSKILNWLDLSSTKYVTTDRLLSLSQSATSSTCWKREEGLRYIEEQTFPQEQADLGVEELLHSVSFACNQPEDRQEGPYFTQSPLLILQILPLCRPVDAGKHIGIGTAQDAEERLTPGILPQYLIDIWAS